MPTSLLLLEFNGCGQCILYDTVDNFTLLSMPLHGYLHYFLQNITK